MMKNYKLRLSVMKTLVVFLFGLAAFLPFIPVLAIPTIPFGSIFISNSDFAFLLWAMSLGGAISVLTGTIAVYSWFSVKDAEKKWIREGKIALYPKVNENKK